MNKLILAGWIAIILLALYLFYVGEYNKAWGHHVYVAELAPQNIKLAMENAGPLYEYRLKPSGRLEINYGDGNWLRLRY